MNLHLWLPGGAGSLGFKKSRSAWLRQGDYDCNNMRDCVVFKQKEFACTAEIEVMTSFIQKDRKPVNLFYRNLFICVIYNLYSSFAKSLGSGLFTANLAAVNSLVTLTTEAASFFETSVTLPNHKVTDARGATIQTTCYLKWQEPQITVYVLFSIHFTSFIRIVHCVVMHD